MAGLFSNFFKKKNKSVIGIDIGTSSIKVVQLREKLGHPLLETYGVIALGPYAGQEVGMSVNLPNRKLSSALTEILTQAKTTTKAGGVAIPFSSSLVSVISLPKVSEEELATMVPIEARKYIPVPISEVSLDWSLISGGDDDDEKKKRKEKKKTIHDPSSPAIKETTDILIAAIHKNTISKYQSIIQSSPLDANFFEIEAFSTVRSILGEEKENDSAVMIMDVGASSTKLYVIDGGVVLNSHTTNKGSQDITSAMATALKISFAEAEKRKRSEGILNDQRISEAVSPTLDYIFLEAKGVADSHHKRFGKKVERIVLVGGGVTAEGFASSASASLEIPVSYGDPFSKIETPDYMKDIVKYNGPEFAVAVGVALRRLEEER